MPSYDHVSTANSSTATLVGDAVFTGVAENVSGFASISLIVKSDVASATDGLSLEFSPDGTNWDVVSTITVKVGASQQHLITVTAKFFRVVYTNGSGAQSSFRLQTILHAVKSPISSVHTQQILESHFDGQLVRQAADVLLDQNAGRIAYISTIQKFGRNPSVSTTEEDIWDSGGVYPWPTGALAVRVRAGGNAADDNSAGAGARTIRVEGLDENFALATEDITLLGATVSAPTTITFIRVFRAYVLTAGTYTGNNTGDISIETTAGTELAKIIALCGQTFMSIYTVPAGKTAYMTRIAAFWDSNLSGTIRGWQRQNADDSSVPVTGKRLFLEFPSLSGQATVDFKSYPSFPAKTDVWIAGRANTTSATAVSEFDLSIVDD